MKRKTFSIENNNVEIIATSSDRQIERFSDPIKFSH